MMVVARVQGQLHAEVLRSKLEAAGIPAILQYESLGVVYGLTVDGLGEVKVLVPEQFEQDALAILAEPPASEEAEE